MTPDYVEKKYNVRERGNRVQIVHMETPVHGLHYVSVNDMVDGEFRHRKGSTISCGGRRCEAEDLAKAMYEREAKGGGE